MDTETNTRVKRTIQKQKNKNTFSNMDKVGLSSDLNMRRILIKKRQDKEDARKFYENSANIEATKKKNTRKFIMRKQELMTFNKTVTSKIKRIKKRTMQMIKLDKYHVRDCVVALKAFYASEVNREENRGDTIRIQVIVSNKMESITLKPIRIQLKIPIHTLEFNANISLITKDKEKISDVKRQNLQDKRVTVFEYQQVKKLQTEGKLVQIVKGTDMLLCDERLYNRLVKQCRKTFSKKKVMPYPVNLKKFIKVQPKTVDPMAIESSSSQREVHINDGMRVGETIDNNIGNLEVETVDDLVKNVIFVRNGGPVYQIAACRVRMNNKDCVKNIINLIYDLIPQILVESPKNSTIMKISLLCDKSKCLEIYRNGYVVNRGQ